MTKPILRVGVLQLTSVDSVDLNLSQIKTIIQKETSNDRQLDLICLPENALYMRVVEGEPIQGLELSDKVFSELAKLAVEGGFFLHIGSTPLRVDGRLYNSSVLISPSGQVQPTYRKMHLFDIHLEGQNPIRESDVFSHGPSPSVVEIFGWKIGESICYDLRFSELYNHYARLSIDLLLIPSAFLVKTGEAHWHSLTRARAIESQAYVVASAQSGGHIGVSAGKRDTFGHSLAIDPWGMILSEQKSGAGISIVELSKGRISEVRRQIPMAGHRRTPFV